MAGKVLKFPGRTVRIPPGRVPPGEKLIAEPTLCELLQVSVAVLDVLLERHKGPPDRFLPFDESGQRWFFVRETRPWLARIRRQWTQLGEQAGARRKRPLTRLEPRARRCEW